MVCVTLHINKNNLPCLVIKKGIDSFAVIIFGMCPRLVQATYILNSMNLCVGKYFLFFFLVYIVYILSISYIQLKNRVSSNNKNYHLKKKQLLNPMCPILLHVCMCVCVCVCVCACICF